MDNDGEEEWVEPPPSESKSSRKRGRNNVKVHGKPAPPPAPSRTPTPVITAPSHTTVAKILQSYHGAPGFGRVFTRDVAPWPVQKEDLTGNRIMTDLFPTEPASLGQPLFLAPLNPAPTTQCVPIVNFYLNGHYSTIPLDNYVFEIYWMLPPENPAEIIKASLAAYIKNLGKHGFSITTEGLTEAEIISASAADVPSLPPGTNQLLSATGQTTLPETFRDLPYRHLLTIPATAPVRHGLMVLSSRQHDWRPQPVDYSNLNLPTAETQLLRAQQPAVLLTSTLPQTARTDTAWIRSEAFNGLTAPACLQFFREAALHTFAATITTLADRAQATVATTVDRLPPAAQQLLQCIGALQPTTDFDTKTIKLGETTRTLYTFEALRSKYNPLQQQGQPFHFFMRHPSKPLPFSVFAQAPRPPAEEKGNGVWHEWFSSSLLVQCTEPLPMETATHEAGKLIQKGYLYKALASRLDHAIITGPRGCPELSRTTALALKPAPDNSVILAHAGMGKVASSFVVALEDMDAYALLSTNPNCTSDIQLPTHIHEDNATHRQIVSITVRPHHRSILGGKYHQLLTDPEVQTKVKAQVSEQHDLPDLTPLTYDAEKKSLKGERILKIQWAKAMIDHPLTLAYNKMLDAEHRKSAPDEDMGLAAEDDETTPSATQ